MKKIFTLKRLIFLLVFTVLVFLGRRIGFFPVLGADSQSFTFFQFFGPVTGSFLGPFFGPIAVCFAHLTDLFLHGGPVSSIGLLGVLPMMFAAYFFGTKKRAAGVLVPLMAMTAFMIHPVGRQVWFFSLFWIIPIISVASKRFSSNMVVKSLGATFTAHAVGTAIWIWTIPMTAAQWISLIPVVMVERMIMAGGIAVSCIVMNKAHKWILSRDNWGLSQDVLTSNRII
jgi:hypothetical protein